LQINWVAIAIYHDIFHDKCLLLFSYLYLQVYSLVQVTRPLHILRGLVAKLTRCDVRLHILLGQHGVPTFYYEAQVSRSCPFYLTSSPCLGMPSLLSGTHYFGEFGRCYYGQSATMIF
jgi:hypothetical protein